MSLNLADPDVLMVKYLGTCILAVRRSVVRTVHGRGVGVLFEIVNENGRRLFESSNKDQVVERFRYATSSGPEDDGSRVTKVGSPSSCDEKDAA